LGLAKPVLFADLAEFADLRNRIELPTFGLQNLPRSGRRDKRGHRFELRNHSGNFPVIIGRHRPAKSGFVRHLFLT
jgi:hypothetical protein